MNDDHDRAREALLASLLEEDGQEEGEWLATHLSTCERCSALREGLRDGLRVLRLPEVTVDSRLVEATRRRVRRRAHDLERARRARLPVLGLATAVLLAAVGAGAGLARCLVLLGAPFDAALGVLLGAGILVWFLPAIPSAGLVWLASTACGPANGESET
jgi:hypothetical protein